MAVPPTADRAVRRAQRAFVGWKRPILRVWSEPGAVGAGEVMTEGCRPPLTTVDLNLTELGHAAATKLLGAIEGHPLEQGVQLMPCRLVTRRSTKMTH